MNYNHLHALSPCNRVENMELKSIVAFVVAALVAFGAYALLSPHQPPAAPPVYHVHADFAVFLDGSRYNFSQEKYMSGDNRTLSALAHLHDMDGGVLHIHSKIATLSEFFSSLNMAFNSTCFALDNGSAYCNTDGKTLKMLVNGQPNSQFGLYKPLDLDRILITYGNQSDAEIASQQSLVSNNSCIYSDKCPERGAPPSEASCLTSEGACPP